MMPSMGSAISLGWIHSAVNPLTVDWIENDEEAVENDREERAAAAAAEVTMWGSYTIWQDRVEKTDKGWWDPPTLQSPVKWSTFWSGWPGDQDIMLMWRWQMLSSVKHFEAENECNTFCYSQSQREKQAKAKYVRRDSATYVKNSYALCT